MRGTCSKITWSKRFNKEIAMTKYFIKCSFIHLYSFVNCFKTSSESPLIRIFFAPKSNKISKPAIKASYSASLFEQNPLILYLNLVGILEGEIIRIPIPTPCLCLEPSKYNFQGRDST
ncbi:hypothetical protein QL285_096780 [Trifolium repens]|nr:hypothetical protein QL285_096780 [Trifolium repens]